MSNVCRVVNAQTDSKDDVDAGDGVDRHRPEVQEADHVNLKTKREENAYVSCLTLFIQR